MNLSRPESDQMGTEMERDKNLPSDADGEGNEERARKGGVVIDDVEGIRLRGPISGPGE